MITDFCTGRQIDTQALLRMARYAEEAKRFDMVNWLMPCRTAGCLVGTYAVREGIVSSEGMFFVNLSMSFGLSENERQFVFGNGHLGFSTRCEHAIFLSQKEAIRRLRKFIYYKLRKSELLADYQAARRMGDVGFVPQVLEAVSCP